MIGSEVVGLSEAKEPTQMTIGHFHGLQLHSKWREGPGGKPRAQMN